MKELSILWCMFNLAISHKMLQQRRIDDSCCVKFYHFSLKRGKKKIAQVLPKTRQKIPHILVPRISFPVDVTPFDGVNIMVPPIPRCTAKHFFPVTREGYFLHYETKMRPIIVESSCETRGDSAVVGYHPRYRCEAYLKEQGGGRCLEGWIQNISDMSSLFWYYIIFSF